MRRSPLSLLVLLPLTACVTVLPASPAPASICRTGAASRLIGQPATPAVAEQIRRTTGARTLRWAGPGIMNTMDLREDRVTVTLDPQRTSVVGIACG